jgi:hypothetical protein
MSANSGNVLKDTEAWEKHWSHDGNAGVILKAASAPATIATPGWAAELGFTKTHDFLSALAPASAGSALLKRCINLRWDRATGIKIPGINAGATYATFVGEGAPMPVQDFTTSGITLTPKKMGILSLFTREIFEHSIPVIEELVGLALRESVGLSLDWALFSASAGTSVQPPGLLNGISATAASTATLPSEAMAEDIATLAAAVSVVASNAPIIIIASPKQAAFARLKVEAEAFEIMASNALAAGTAIALASNTLASVSEEAPTFNSSLEAGPIQLDTQPVGGTIAAVSVSTFQADLVSLRLRFSVNWGLRNSAGIAFVQNTVW